jgi:hypothetical protein
MSPVKTNAEMKIWSFNCSGSHLKKTQKSNTASKLMTKMMDEAIRRRQENVIENIDDEDFEKVKDWDPEKLFALLSDEQKAPFLESVVEMVCNAVKAREMNRKYINDVHLLSQVSHFLLIAIFFCIHHSNMYTVLFL